MQVRLKGLRTVYAYVLDYAHGFCDPEARASGGRRSSQQSGPCAPAAGPEWSRCGHTVHTSSGGISKLQDGAATYPSSARALGPLRRAQGLQSPGVKFLKVTTWHVRETTPNGMSSGLVSCCKQELSSVQWNFEEDSCNDQYRGEQDFRSRKGE